MKKSTELLGHGNYLPWINEEFGWSEATALRFVRVAELGESVNLTDLDVPVSDRLTHEFFQRDE